MNKVIEILMTRDGIAKDEAIALINEARKMMIEDPWGAEDIMLEMLELEMNYIMDIF